MPRRDLARREVDNRYRNMRADQPVTSAVGMRPSSPRCPHRFEEIFVDTPLSVCITRDGREQRAINISNRPTSQRAHENLKITNPDGPIDD